MKKVTFELENSKNITNSKKEKGANDDSDDDKNIPTEDSNLTLIPAANVNIISENKFSIDHKLKAEQKKKKILEIETLKSILPIKIKKPKHKKMHLNPRAITFQIQIQSKNENVDDEPENPLNEENVTQTHIPILKKLNTNISEELNPNLSKTLSPKRENINIGSSNGKHSDSEDDFEEEKDEPNSDLSQEEKENGKQHNALRKLDTTNSVIQFSKVQLIPIKRKDIDKFYRFIKIIDRGNFSEVWLAEQVTSFENFEKRAIKVIEKNLIKWNEKTKELFQSELKILQQLDHPNIVRFFESFETEDKIFLVFEYLKGKTLSKNMEEKYYSENEISNLFRQILSALNYCHQKNVIHRDIKPDNIMYETNHKNSIVKIIDFGHSTIYRHEAKISGIYGTPIYMAPEIIKEQGHNEKCDIWSLGLILYQILSGSFPFNSNSLQLLFNQIKISNFSTENLKGDGWAKVSINAKETVSLMLAQEPEHRPSALELLNLPFFQKENSKINTSVEFYQDVYNNLKQFCINRGCIKAIKNYAAIHSKLNKNYKEVRKLFMMIDLNKDGKISKEEIVEAIDKMDCGYTISEQSLDTLFQKIDTDHNGYIDYTEFLAACVKLEIDPIEKNLIQAFEKLDPEGEGFVETVKLKNLLMQEYGDVEILVKSIIHILDLNHKEKINYEDFKECLQVYEENMEESEEDEN